jgi:hypothetical protein
MRTGFWYVVAATAATVVAVSLDREEKRPASSDPDTGEYVRTTQPYRKPRALAQTVTWAASTESPSSPDAFEFGPMVKIQTRTEGGGWETIEAVAVGDVTGDGRDDLIVQPYTNMLRVYVQQSDGTLAPPREFRYRSDDNYLHRKNMVLADFNGDGVLDVAASGNDERSWAHGLVNLLLSGPGGSLTHRQALTNLGGAVDSWSVLDVDGDGALDIVGSENVSDYSSGDECGPQRYTCPRLRVMYGDGKGDFAHVESVKLGEPHNVITLPAVDVDGDGMRDVVYSFGSEASHAGKTVARLRQAEGGVGEPQSLFSHGLHDFVGQVAADFTGDGRIDFLAGATLYARGSTGIYAQTDLPAYTIRSNWNVAADFDGDGLTDFATVQMANWTMYVVLYQQRDGGLNRAYASRSYFELDKVNREENALAVGDLNSDGCKDLVVSASYEGVLIFPGRNCVRRSAPTMVVCDLQQAEATPSLQGLPPVAQQSASRQ